MTRLESILSGIINAKRVYRDNAANEVLSNPELIEELIMLALNSSSLFQIKAAWILELVFLAKPNIISPYLDYFCTGLKSVKNESALRSISKICRGIVSKKNENQPNFILTTTQKERIVEASFDWLISDRKTATQAFAMDSLYFLSNEFTWIKDNLREILQKDIPLKSPGYVSHARMILAKLEKEQKQ
ncbi:hypothetical protein [Namhaeicola litoreus]|uniref:Adenylosuccinate lyase n=1 Tax=Namhaeicola litoreus TaxID=1052145 RepID=A0ABW3Y4B1_9FLAO